MQKYDRKRWLDLCRQAAVEQDPQELLKLVREINRLLEEEQTRRKPERNADSSDDAA